MACWKIFATLALLGLLGGNARALECYYHDGLPQFPLSGLTQTCGGTESTCFQYEDSAAFYKQDVSQLVYHAGCGRCPINTPFNCTECSDNLCNDRLETVIQAENQRCFAYSATYDSVGPQKMTTKSELCPTFVHNCFQVHYPAGAASPGWTFIIGGCGAQVGCTREKPATKCLICNSSECNKPDVPGVVLSSDDNSGSRLAPGIATSAWGALWLWVLLLQLS